MFSNTVKVEWKAGSSRKMTLLEDVTFTDSHGKVWLASADSKIDGASIPRFFWFLVGSPFVGRYRRASVIHDVYCVTRSEPYQAVHKVFNEMMKADKVTKLKRKIMFKAVWYFGPRW